MNKSYVKFPRWIVWGFGAIILFSIVATQISNWFKLEWSYMRWVALFGDLASFIIGSLLSIYYDKKDKCKVEKSKVSGGKDE